MISFAIVYPPRVAQCGQNRRGFRHVVEVSSDRTLCGRLCDLWFTEAQFDGVIGCKICKRVHARMVLS